MIETYIRSNPHKFSFLLHGYNNVLGGNKIKISAKNSSEIGAALMKKTSILVNGVNNTIIIKDLSRLMNCNIYIQGNNNRIVINERVYLNQAELWIEDDNNKISIGEHTSIYGKTHLAAIEGTSIKIGNDCMIGDTHFRTGDSHSIMDLNGKRINMSKDIVIGDHVWVCTQAIILKGTTVANNCIVSAGALVTKKFSEENVILGGNPARIIRSNIDWSSERI
jgi:acetyltransferase-like isoleucine patch superfamily enzyme